MKDCLLIVVDNMVECSTHTFNIWASTKTNQGNSFLKEHMGKSASVQGTIKDAPTVELMCFEADDK
jgi:hypothetical protein